MRIRAEDLDWLLTAAGEAPGSRVRHVFRRRYVDGYRDGAIAAELGIRPATVRGYAYAGWQRIRRAAGTDRTGEYGTRVADCLELAEVQLDGAESFWEHCTGLLRAIQNGSSCQAVTLDTVITAVRAVAARQIGS